jgi:integrase
MIRPRSTNNPLPSCLYLKSGRYWFVKRNKWHDFGTDHYEALKRYAEAHRPKSSNGMGKLLDDWLEAAADAVKASTLTHYRSAVESKIKPAFIEFAPAEVESPDVAAFLYHHRAHPNMANRMRTILKMAFDLAIRQGIAKTNPVIATQRNKEKKRARYLTDAEWTAIHTEAGDALKTIMDVSFFTAQRIGDVLKIRLADIRPDGHLYVKQQKTGKELLIEITPELRAALDNARAKGSVRSIYLFSQANGKPWTYWAIRDKWKAAATAAGVEDTRLHDNRAKGITEANRQGLNAQLLAGHSTQKQTDSYIRDREIDIAKPPSFRKKA